MIGCTTLNEHLHLDRGRPRTISLMAAWVACDGPDCEAIMSVPGTDGGDVIDDAMADGWDCANARDLCPECARVEREMPGEGVQLHPALDGEPEGSSNSET